MLYVCFQFFVRLFISEVHLSRSIFTLSQIYFTSYLKLLYSSFLSVYLEGKSQNQE